MHTVDYDCRLMYLLFQEMNCVCVCVYLFMSTALFLTGGLALIKKPYISMGRGPSCPGCTNDKHINTVFPVTLKYCNIYRSTSPKIRQGVCVAACAYHLILVLHK